MRPFFKLYAFAIPVQGEERSAIYDLQRNRIHFIPHSMHEVIEQLEVYDVEMVRNSFSEEDRVVFDSYIIFLQDERLGFYTTEPDHFPKLSLSWFSPEHIQCAVIDYRFQWYDIYQVLNQLDDLLCKHLELRISNFNSIEEIEKILRCAEQTMLRSVILLIDHGISDLLIESYEELYERFKKLDCVVVYNFSKDIQSKRFDKHIVLTTKNFEEKLFHQHFYSDRFYVVNMSFFCEAQMYNPYYYKKVCIDQKGFIKNCLLQEIYFGNVSTDLLREIISLDVFQKHWFVPPSQIEDVRNSELRYAVLLSNELVEVSSGMYRIKK